jgi:hypothetical protein
VGSAAGDLVGDPVRGGGPRVERVGDGVASSAGTPVGCSVGGGVGSSVGGVVGGLVEQHWTLEKSSHVSVPRDSNVARTA